MNSRGTLISHRISGDTLAIKDTVAMTPTIQPAVAGIHRKREFDRLVQGGVERGIVSVTDREDIPSIHENPGEAPRRTMSRLSGSRPARCVAEDGPAAASSRITPLGC